MNEHWAVHTQRHVERHNRLRRAFCLACLLVALPQRARTQTPDTVLLRWHLGSNQRLNVRSKSSIELDTVGGKVGTVSETNVLVLFGACGASAVRCDSVAVLREAFTVGTGSTVEEASLAEAALRGEGVTLLQIDSLLRATSLRDARPGQWLPAAVLEDFLDAIPLQLPLQRVGQGSSWQFITSARRTWRESVHNTLLVATASIDSIIRRNGGTFARIHVRGDITIRAGSETLYSQDQLDAEILWDVSAGRPVSAESRHHGSVVYRGVTHTTRGRTSVAVDTVSGRIIP